MTLADLTPREREVALLLDDAHTCVSVGVALRISHRTVEAHVSAIAAKLAASGFGQDDWGPKRRVREWLRGAPR